MLAMCAQICWYFSNWTHKNIPDWQQCVSFRKSQKVKNHSSTVHMYSTISSPYWLILNAVLYNQLTHSYCSIFNAVQSTDLLLLVDPLCCTISWPSPIGWSSMLYNQLTCSYWLILHAVQSADQLLLVDPQYFTISWPVPILACSYWLTSILACSYWLIPRWVTCLSWCWVWTRSTTTGSWPAAPTILSSQHSWSRTHTSCMCSVRKFWDFCITKKWRLYIVSVLFFRKIIVANLSKHWIHFVYERNELTTAKRQRYDIFYFVF